MEDLYELLNISRNASKSEIKSAYRKLAKKYHPDLNQGDEEAQEHFKKINIAYEVLGDEEKRSQYDRYGDAIFDSGGSGQTYSADFSDLFGSIFDDFFGGGFSASSSNMHARNAPRKGGDIEHQINLDFFEAIFGTEVEMSIRRREVCSVCNGEKAKPGSKKEVCSTCGGSGKIQKASNTAFGSFIRMESCPSCDGTGEYIEEACEKCHAKGYETRNKTMKAQIPEGVDNGTIIKISGEGHAGVNGGPPGDLYIRIMVKDHEFFERNGLDVYYELPIRFTQAVLGDNMEVPTLTGLEKFNLPPGTQSGEVFTLKGKGIPRPHSSYVGDIHFMVKVVIPKKINDEQRNLLKEFDKIDGESSKEQKGFLDKIKEFFK